MGNHGDNPHTLTLLDYNTLHNSSNSRQGGYSLGGVHGHIKAHGLSLFPHQRKLCTEDLLDRHALGMLGRTLIIFYDTHSLAG